MNDIEVQNELIYHKILSVMDGGKLQLSGPFLTKLYKTYLIFRKNKIRYDGLFLVFTALDNLKRNLTEEKIRYYTIHILEKYLSSPEAKKQLGI